MAALDKYFDGLKEDGRLDSSGAFTLDPQKVQWKLAQYQLASPALYPLFLLKAACAAGARSVKVEHRTSLLSSETSVEITIPGLLVSEVQLKSSTLGRSKTAEEIRYLVVALNAVRNLGTAEILSRGLHLKIEDGEPLFEVPSKERDGTRFIVRGDSLDHPEALLRERGRWSPLPLSCLREERSRVILDSDCPAGTVAVCTGPGYRSKKKAPWGRFLLDCPDLISLTWSPGARTRSLGVHRGVNYPLNVELPNGFEVVIKCDDLDLDLSYENFLQNRALEAKQDQIRAIVSACVEAVVALERSWEPTELEEITRQIKACWREGSCSETLRRFYKRAVTHSFPLQPQGVDGMLERLVPFERDRQIVLYLRRYRREVVETRAFYVLTAQDWVTEEIQFRQAVGWAWREADTIRRLLEYLFHKKTLDWNKWKIHPFLSSLHLLLSKEEVRQNEIDSTEGVHASWIEPLTLCDERPEEARFAPLRILGFLESGLFEKAAAEAKTSSASSFVPFRRLWYQLILDFSRGRLSWLQYIQLRAKASFATETEQRLLKRARAMKSRGRSFEDWAVYHGVFERGFWFLAVYYTCLQRKQGRSAHQFWCKVLLQAAIGYPGDDGSIEENLSRPLRLPLLSK